MAGIGFELKKMFHKKGFFSVIKAYGYAGIVVTGPMILGIMFLLGIRVLGMLAGADEHQMEFLNCMITVTMLCSLCITGFFSMPVTRYIADALFEENREKIMPSFWGSVSIMLIVGGGLYAVFLLFAGVKFVYAVLCFVLLGELILVYSQMNYLTAIKDYRGIIVTFAISVVISILAGAIALSLGKDVIATMLLTVCVAYGIMAVRYQYLLLAYFPKGRCSSLYFLKWFDKYPQLAWVGLFSSIGMYGHILIMWTGAAHKQIQGLFYATPVYDIPALLGFVSILATLVNFVTSVEVVFYPKYRNYFSLFNDGGSFGDIEQAEKEMKESLYQELSYTFMKQFFVTVLFIVGGTFLLPYLPLGLTEDMLGIYRVLCVAYAFYAAGNCLMLIQLYFSDNVGAFISTFCFMLAGCAGTFFLRNASVKLFGVGFLIGGLVYTVVALILLLVYLHNLMYHVLCKQPIVVKEKIGIATKISRRCESKYHKTRGSCVIERESQV